MAKIRIDQTVFNQGQLDARVQSRIDSAIYYKAAKEITNGLVIPQGGVQRRWGSKYVDTCSVVGTNLNYADISNLIYNDNIVYLMLWEALSLKIYLENVLVATVVTQYRAEDIPTLNFSQIQTRAIVSSGNYKNQELVRSNNAPVAITGFSGLNNTLTAALGATAGQIFPAQFTIGVSLPTTSPQIYTGRDYFIKMITATTFQIYSTSEDASTGNNPYVISSSGNTANVVVQNTWAISDINFKFYPAYDFNGGYFGSTFTFTPSAVSGNITITASSAIFTSAMVGGVYEGNGGIVRLTVFTDTTHMNGYTITPFTSATAIRGDLSFLGEPAWSNIRGWPKVSAFIQQRFALSNTSSLPNGQWLSVINDVYNFDDSQSLADDAISYYPESGVMSVVQSMTSGRSLIVHTNTGNYSSPVQSELALTPSNYVLIEQNKFGVGKVQPVFIDNQIFFVDRSGNNIINMIWEFAQSSYVTNNVSVKSSSIVRTPTDMTAFSEPNFVDGFYVVFVNTDGTMGVLQTLSEENILAFSLANSNTYITNGNETSYDIFPSSFKRVVSSNNKLWYLIDRKIPVSNVPVAITNFSALNDTLHAVAHGMTLNSPTLVSFTTTGSLPATVPQITTTDYFWAFATSADNFQVYYTEQDATINPDTGVPFGTPFEISSSGVNSNVVVWSNTNKLMIEQIDFDFYTDSSTLFTSSVATQTITGLSHLNGQVVQVVADGFVLKDRVVFGGQITIEKESFSVRIGLRYETKLVPLPPCVPDASGFLYSQKHIRNLYISYFETIGAKIQGFDIPVISMQQVVLGAYPEPKTGVFEYTLMEGWDGATPTNIEIVQNSPLPMTIIGLSYIIEVS